MQRGAINFNANNIKIAELEKKVEVIETDVRVIGRKQDKCQYCNTDKHGD
jgi:tRNA1(Val) A37 N6-methylase TrmN6